MWLKKNMKTTHDWEWQPYHIEMVIWGTFRGMVYYCFTHIIQVLSIRIHMYINIHIYIYTYIHIYIYTCIRIYIYIYMHIYIYAYIYIYVYIWYMKNMKRYICRDSSSELMYFLSFHLRWFRTKNYVSIHLNKHDRKYIYVCIPVFNSCNIIRMKIHELSYKLMWPTGYQMIPGQSLDSRALYLGSFIWSSSFCTDPTEGLREQFSLS